jgi:hypothetical protein
VLASEPKPSRKVSNTVAPNLTKKSVKEASAILPELAKAKQAKDTAILLGGQVRAAADADIIWKHYVPKVAQHQLTLARVLHRVGEKAARTLVAAVATTPVMQASAVDQDFVGHDDTMNKLQRALWCGGSTTATGLHRYTNMMVAHRIIGSLEWAAELKLQRIKTWRRLTQHLKEDSWPEEVALASLDKAKKETDKHGEIHDRYLKAVHNSLQE